MGSQENELHNGSDVVIVYGNAIRLLGMGKREPCSAPKLRVVGSTLLAV